MAETGADAAQRYREHMRDKAARLGGGEDAQRVDSSEFEPGEKLYAGVKTGMRPVSRQARKRGGHVVHGEQSPLGAHALKRPGRTPRKGGGGIEAEVGKGYVNRDQKAANAQREGEYPNGGMKKGGRAERAGGGYIPREEREGGNFTRTLKSKTASSDVEKGGRPASEDGRLGRASGGRTARQAGGPLATPLAAGMGGQGRMNFNFGPQSSTGAKLGIKTGGVVRADGGRAKAHERYGHGPSCSCPDCKGKGRAGRAYGGAAPGPCENIGTSDAGPLGAAGPGENKGTVGQPSFRHRSPRGENSSRARTLASAKGRANGGSADFQHDYDDNESTAERSKRLGPAFRQPNFGRLKDPAVKASIAKANETIGRAFGPKKAEGGEVAKGALKQHRLEHKVMGKANGGASYSNTRGPDGKPLKIVSNPQPAAGRAPGAYSNTRGEDGKPLKITEKAYGGAAPGPAEHAAAPRRASGGRAGKGKTNINIIVGTPGGMSQGAGPMGPNPQLAIKPPTPPPAPMPMPPGGPAPGAAGPPMPMPIPVPMGGAGGGPPGMPPRARGGRAPKVGSEPEAGSGSGIGRLQKAAEYGHRSREGAGMRK